MKGTLATILSAAVLLSWTGAAIAAPPKQSQPPAAKQRSASPTPTPSPSVELSTFVNANLDAVTGPLEQKVALPRAELEQLRASYAARLTKASPAERKQLKAA